MKVTFSSFLLLVTFLFINNSLLFAQPYVDLPSVAKLQAKLREELTLAINNNYIVIDDGRIVLTEDGFIKAKELLKRSKPLDKFQASALSSYLQGFKEIEAYEPSSYYLGWVDVLGWGMVAGGLFWMFIDNKICFLLSDENLRDMARAIEKEPAKRVRNIRRNIIRRTCISGIVLLGAFLLYSNDAKAQGLPSDWYMSQEDRVDAYRSDLVKEDLLYFCELHPDDAEKISYESKATVYNTVVLLNLLNK